MAETVREFVNDCYQLITAANPVVPLHGNDLSKGIQLLNKNMNRFAGTGLNMTIASTATTNLAIGQQNVVVGPPTFLPFPDIPLGRMANIESAWLLLDGVTYPLIIEERPNFLESWKYDPLQGLPRFLITFPETEIVTLRIYPAPSQFFQLNVRAKFQFANYTANDSLSNLPDYYNLFLLYEVTKFIAFGKARAAAWTPELEAIRKELKDEMQAASEVNLAITGDRASLLNANWRVMAGI